MKNRQHKGTAFVVCAPSGTGKTTLSKRLFGEYPQLYFSISCTTRPPRPGEEEGKDYYFISQTEFQEKIAQNHFAEWAEVHGNFYGTPLEAARAFLDKGLDLLFDIDVQGAIQLKKSMPEAFFTFIMPPSRAVLEERLRKRGTDSEEAIILRLRNAAFELREASRFDAWVINDDQDKAFADLRAAYLAARLVPNRSPEFLTRLLEQF